MPRPSLLYDVLREQPPVVAGLVNTSADARALAERLQTVHPGLTFVAVVTANETEHSAEIIEQLRPVVAEMIFTGGPSRSARSGADLADRALNEFGVGRDFVFTVPVLSGAIEYAIARVIDEADDWTGTGVLVAGSISVMDAAVGSYAGEAEAAQGIYSSLRSRSSWARASVTQRSVTAPTLTPDATVYHNTDSQHCTWRPDDA